MSGSSTPKIPMACLLCPEEDEDGIHNPFQHIEIVGLHSNGNGRQCSIHNCCGREVKVGDILRMKRTVVNNTDGTSEEALCCVVIKSGEEKCRVGFVPRFLLSSQLVIQNINKYMQVVELFDEAKNTAKKAKSKEFGGIAGVVFLDEIPSLE